MVKYRNFIFAVLILFFLIFSFAPTLFEISQKDSLADKNREFILEHNYYWPDFNLYLSKIRQGFEGRLLASEKYTSEKHKGSLIQEFYVVLGWGGRFLGLDPNSAYQLGRAVFSLLLLTLLARLCISYFPKPVWQILAFIITVTSGSFPRFATDAQGLTHLGRYMDWWTNIDALQRITFIPHILAGQVLSFYLLHQITNNKKQITQKRLVLYIILGNILGLVFPPSLMTLNGVILLIILVKLVKNTLRNKPYSNQKVPILKTDLMKKTFVHPTTGYYEEEKQNLRRLGESEKFGTEGLRGTGLFFIIFTLPSLLYIFILTKQIPWSALITTHKLHPSPILFTDYILGTGPIFFLGLAGMVLSVIQRRNKFQPLIFWILTTFGFAVFFTYFREQSPLRFTQTGLFIPLGILGAYFLEEIWYATKSKIKSQKSKIQFKNQKLEQNTLDLDAGDAREGSQTKMYRSLGNSSGRTRKLELFGKTIFVFFIIFYIFGSLAMMKVSLDWQTNWITQLVRATYPPVPYSPQAMFPLKSWVDGLRWLRDNTNHDDVVLAEVTAENYIPAYSGNFVYFGQANTYEYERKAGEADAFFRGKMIPSQAELFLKQGRIKYIFVGPQEQDKLGEKKLEAYYPFLKSIYTNPLVLIYQFFTL